MCIRRRRRRAATTSPPTAAAMLRRATPPRRTTQAENRPSPAADNALNTYQERITALPSHVTVPWSRNRSRGYPATHQQMQNRHLHRGTQLSSQQSWVLCREAFEALTEQRGSTITDTRGEHVAEADADHPCADEDAELHTQTHLEYHSPGPPP